MKKEKDPRVKKKSLKEVTADAASASNNGLFLWQKNKKCKDFFINMISEYPKETV